MILLIGLAALAILGIVGTTVVTLRDGYRRFPTRSV
jgi:hypothetical protein